MINKDIRESLQAIAISTRKHYAKALREIGLYLGQELALLYLWEEDGLTQSQIKNKTGSEASTISNMLRKLEEDNIIYRKRDQKDSRVVHVFLTEKGKGLEEQVKEIWQKHEDALLTGIIPEERLMLRRMLLAIENNLATKYKEEN